MADSCFGESLSKATGAGVVSAVDMFWLTDFEGEEVVEDDGDEMESNAGPG